MTSLNALWSETSGVIRVVVCGDVHYDWGPQDRRALQFLKPHAVLLLGDFGEEATDIVEEVCRLPQDKAVILGNHDCWHSMYPTGLPEYSGARKQLNDLGQDHLAWSAKHFWGAEHPPFTVVGGRPFSQGGDWAAVAPFYKELYGMDCMQQSADRTADCIRQQPEGQPLVVIGHNGPQGLGSTPECPAGKDFSLDPLTGGVQQEDFGDWDLREALADTSTRQRVCAVVFGHMHHRLNKVAGGGLRNMAALDPTTSTVYLNAAVVPRHDRVTDGERGSVQASHFLAIEIRNGAVVTATNLWVHVPSDGHAEPRVVKCEGLLRSSEVKPGVIERAVFLAHTQSWSQPVQCTLIT